jgi:methylmalonyl-CoA/ethylmalonyl-CoA epimerase
MVMSEFQSLIPPGGSVRESHGAQVNGAQVNGAQVNDRAARAAIAEHLVRIDHIAVAVEDLRAAERWCSEVLGFRCVEQRTLEGRSTGMISTVMEAGPIVIVLVQGTSPASQVSRFVERYGQGVQHVALEVRDIGELVRKLSERGLCFGTSVVESAGVRQTFTRRNQQTGLMLELIERGDFHGFSDQNVTNLFRELEDNDEF